MQLPLFDVPSDWRPIEDLPDLSYADALAVDVETYDPGLRKRGPGSIAREGYIVGISLATDRESFYLPVKHYGGGNADLHLVQRYVRDQLSNPRQIKVGANILYDLEWLRCDWGVTVAGPYRDVLVNEHLIDENEKRYNLDRVLKKYVGVGKDETLLQEASLRYFGDKADPKENLWKLPAKFVGPYAEGDTKELLYVLRTQEELIRAESLTEIYDVESRLIPMLLAMRLRGVPVDLDQGARIQAQLQDRENTYLEELRREAGRSGINVWSAEDLGRAFDAVSLTYPRSEKLKQPSFTQAWLEQHPSKLAKLVVEIRKLNRLREAFIGSVIMEHSINGRVHCQFNQAATVTGRFSSSNPNLQQIPARTEDGKFIRSCFVPEEGCTWDCYDYSQIEPRIQVHYAYVRGCTGAAKARDRYAFDPSTDFHQMTAELTGLERRPAKTIHLALSYGMGLVSLADSLGMTLDEAHRLRVQYNGYMPFLDEISRTVAKFAQQRGYITTLLGRRAHFPFFESSNFDVKDPPIRDETLAKERWGERGYRRAFTHKAFNRLIQGSAADVMKKSMVNLYESGITAEIGVPHLTVHDELDLSMPTDKISLRKEIIKIMTNCVDLSVPLQVDLESGPNWCDVL